MRAWTRWVGCTWPQGFRCSRRAERVAWRSSNGLLECAICGRRPRSRRQDLPSQSDTAADMVRGSVVDDQPGAGHRGAYGLVRTRRCGCRWCRFDVTMVRPLRDRSSGPRGGRRGVSRECRGHRGGGEIVRSRSARSPCRSISPRVSGGAGCKGSRRLEPERDAVYRTTRLARVDLPLQPPPVEAPRPAVLRLFEQPILAEPITAAGSRTPASPDPGQPVRPSPAASPP